MMRQRISSIFFPVDRSMTVSAPKWTAVWSLASSSSRLLVTAELPMFALILQHAAIPIPIGSSRYPRWTRLAGITMRPAATSARISSASSPSRCATHSISGVIFPARASSNWVIGRGSLVLRTRGAKPSWFGSLAVSYHSAKQATSPHAERHVAAGCALALPGHSGLGLERFQVLKQGGSLALGQPRRKIVAPGTLAESSRVEVLTLFFRRQHILRHFIHRLDRQADTLPLVRCIGPPPDDRATIGVEEVPERRHGPDRNIRCGGPQSNRRRGDVAARARDDIVAL